MSIWILLYRTLRCFCLFVFFFVFVFWSIDSYDIGSKSRSQRATQVSTGVATLLYLPLIVFRVVYQHSFTLWCEKINVLYQRVLLSEETTDTCVQFYHVSIIPLNAHFQFHDTGSRKSREIQLDILRFIELFRPTSLAPYAHHAHEMLLHPRSFL